MDGKQRAPEQDSNGMVAYRFLKRQEPLLSGAAWTKCQNHEAQWLSNQPKPNVVSNNWPIWFMNMYTKEKPMSW